MSFPADFRLAISPLTQFLSHDFSTQIPAVFFFFFSLYLNCISHFQHLVHSSVHSLSLSLARVCSLASTRASIHDFWCRLLHRFHSQFDPNSAFILEKFD